MNLKEDKRIYIGKTTNSECHIHKLLVIKLLSNKRSLRILHITLHSLVKYCHNSNALVLILPVSKYEKIQ